MRRAAARLALGLALALSGEVVAGFVEQVGEFGEALGQARNFAGPQLIDLLVEQFDLELGFDVDFVIIFSSQAIDILLAVPVFYSLFDDMKQMPLFARMFGRKRAPAAPRLDPMPQPARFGTGDPA